MRHLPSRNSQSGGPRAEGQGLTLPTAGRRGVITEQQDPRYSDRRSHTGVEAEGAGTFQGAAKKQGVLGNVLFWRDPGAEGRPGGSVEGWEGGKKTPGLLALAC